MVKNYDDYLKADYDHYLTISFSPYRTLSFIYNNKKQKLPYRLYMQTYNCRR